MSKKGPAKSWDTPERHVFSAQIREIRQIHYPSQEAFADALKVAPPYISQIESGRRIPSDELLCEMSHLLPDAADWKALRIEAHRLRSPQDLAVLLTEREPAEPAIFNDRWFRRLRKELEDSDLPPARRDKLIARWLEEIAFLKEERMRVGRSKVNAREG